MTLKRKLSNIEKGYAEVVYTDPESKKEFNGMVETETFVAYTDFEKDEEYKVWRWVAYRIYPWSPPGTIVGRLTGYKTRKEALAALDEEAKRYLETDGRCNE